METDSLSNESKILVRASLGKKKVSCVVDRDEMEEFMTLYSGVLKTFTMRQEKIEKLTKKSKRK